MNRAQFLSRLREHLAGLPQTEIDDIVADYTQHFAEGVAAGRSEEEVASALGDPDRLARELRAEAGLRRWEERRNVRNLMGAFFALVGLATVDVLLLMPVLFFVALFLFIFCIVLFALFIAGVVLVLGMLNFTGFGTAMVARGLSGAGLVGLAVGGGAVLLFFLHGLMRMLGQYARLHYRLLSPSR